tara:strand:- start:1889 stop:2329 length:441 start_codon:yes stop_codon:yes gene_type:complete
MNIQEYMKDNKNRPFAVASMCADPIHHGHINIINQAKRYGNVIIGLMTDEAMTGYKRKPLLKFENRIKVIRELKSVANVLPFDNLNFADIAKKYKFEFFLHGDDWMHGVQAESRLRLIETMQQWGGKVIDVPYTEGVSSTDLTSNL